MTALVLVTLVGWVAAQDDVPLGDVTIELDLDVEEIVEEVGPQPLDDLEINAELTLEVEAVTDVVAIAVEEDHEHDDEEHAIGIKAVLVEEGTTKEEPAEDKESRLKDIDLTELDESRPEGKLVALPGEIDSKVLDELQENDEDEDIKFILDNSQFQMEAMLNQVMDPLVRRTIQHSGINEERSEKLTEAKEATVKAIIKRWRKDNEKKLRDMDKKQIENMAKNGHQMGVSYGDDAYDPSKEETWTTALETILTKEEHADLKKSIDSIRPRRAEALARIILAEIDPLIGFKEEQREPIVKLCIDKMLALPKNYFDPPMQNGYMSIDLGQLLAPIKTVSEIADQLDEVQAKAWKAVNAKSLTSNPYRSSNNRKLSVEDQGLGKITTKIDAERLISRALWRWFDGKKDPHLAKMKARVSMLTAQVDLSPEVLEQFHAAAKGTAEWMATQEFRNEENYSRRQFSNLQPKDVADRLQNYHMPNWGYNRRQENPKIWTNALKTLLTEEQRAIYSDLARARKEWKNDAFAAFVISEVEKFVPIDEPARGKLRTRLAEIIHEFEQEFNSTFSRGWHLQGYYSCMPLAMIEEEEMKALFTESQREAIQTSCLTNCVQFVDQIRRRRDQRQENGNGQEEDPFAW